MKPLPWSFSSLSDFNNCPKAYYEKRIAKSVVDPPNEAGLWGDYVHREFQKYLEWEDQPAWDGTPAVLPGNLVQYQPYLESLKRISGRMLVECKYAIDLAQQPCDFFAENVWCRSILDVLVLDGALANIIDHKTGKMKPDSRQLKLSALMVFAHHPEVEVVKTGFAWLKDVQLTKDEFLRDAVTPLWEEFVPDLSTYARAFAREEFPPRPSGLCHGWCPVTDCEFWKPKRR